MELRDYLNVIRTRKWVIIQAVVVVTVTAIVIAMIQPRVYEGEAKVLISESDTGAALLGTVLPELSSQPERSLQTQVQLMQLRPLAEETIRTLGLGVRPDDLLKNITVAAVGQTNVVSIRATAATPEEAAEIANTMAEQFVTWSQTSKRESIRAAADEVESRLADVEEQILALGRRIQEEGKSDELAVELNILTGSYTTLAEKLETLRVNEQLETGSASIVSEAIPDNDPIAPAPLRNGALGLAAGIVLGIAMAFLYEYLDDTVKSSDEIERVFGAPVLGTIPVDKSGKNDLRTLAVLESPNSIGAEAYRVLRNSLDFINFEHDMKTVLVTSAAPGEGKSTVAANLAASLAQAGKKVVLVACDFRRPTTEVFFGVNNLIGLSDVLLGSHSLKSALQRPGEESILVLTSGKLPPNPSELLGSTKMQSLIQELEEWADWVVIDTPPLLAVADAASVARWADGVLMIAQAGRSRRDAGRKAVELLGKVGARIVGVVVWGLSEGRAAEGYGYYQGDYYAYAGYYDSAEREAQSSKKHKTSGRSGQDYEWVPEESASRRIARVLGKALAALLGFLVIVIIVGLVAYFLDQYLGWGLVNSVISVLG